MIEILPGVWHWTTVHENWDIPLHSCFFPDLGGGTVIDPRMPPEGKEWFGEHGEPAHAIHCHSAGMHEFTRGEIVEPYEHGDILEGGIEALEVGVLCPEETALLVPVAGGVLALGDSVINDDGELGFVPDEHMGDDPPAVKRGVREILGRHMAREFRHLFLAHGGPIIGDSKKRLGEFVVAG